MSSIADAYVDLHVNGDAIEGEVRSEVKGVGPSVDKESDKTGKHIGDRMASGFLKGFATKLKASSSKMGKSFKDAFKGFNPRGLMIPALAAAIPLITSSLSALTGALTAFTGAVVQAGGASLSFVGILGSLIQAKLVAGIAFKDFTKAVAGDEEALKALSPAARAAANAFADLGDQWGGVKNAIQQNVFKGLAADIMRTGKVVLPVLRKELGGTGAALNGIFRDLAGFGRSEFFVTKFGQALRGNNKILATLGKAAVPLLKGILGVFTALQPSANRLADIIARSARGFAQWANAAGRAESINAFMRRAFKSAGNLWGIFKNLGKTIYNVFSAATPTGDGILKTLNDMTSRLAKFTALASSKNAIADWAKQGTAVTGQLFSGLGKVWTIIQPLFNPAIAGGFLSIFEKIGPTIVSIVGAIQGALAPVLNAIGEAFAKNGPKFAALFKALGPLLVGVGAVIGEIITQSLDMLGTIASVITPVVKIISNILGPVLVKFAPIIAFLILAFTNWGGAIVKVIPIVGRFIAPLVELASAILKGVAPALKFMGTLIGVTLKAAGAIIKGFFKIGEASFKGLGKVIGVAVRVIATVIRTYFNIYKTIIVTAFKVIRTVISVAWKVISTVIRGAVNLIRGIISRGWAIVRTVTSTAFNAIKGVVSNVWNAISGVVSKGVSKVVGFIKGLPSKILNLAGVFLEAGKTLGSKVINGLWDGLKATGGLVGDLASSIKSAINSALSLPITIKGPGPLPDFTIPAFARGGVAPGGPALVGERGPEIVDLPRGSKVHTAAETRRMAKDGRGWPRKMILRIGAKDFVAYVEEIADDRIDAADSLSWQGA